MELVNDSLARPFYIIWIWQSQSDRAIVMLFK